LIPSLLGLENNGPWGCHSAEVHELFHALVCRPKTLPEHLQCGHGLCCVGQCLGHGEIKTMLWVIVVFGTGAHDIGIYGKVSQSYYTKKLNGHYNKPVRV
jgi:hypothetical protein